MNFERQVQYAIDVLDHEVALGLAHQAFDVGLNRLEVGHLLIKVRGLGIVSEMKAKLPQAVIVADMKTMDMGADEVIAASNAGADAVQICAAANDVTIGTATAAGMDTGTEVVASLMGVGNPESRIRALERLGVTAVIIHKSADGSVDWTDTHLVEETGRLVRHTRLKVGIGGGVRPKDLDVLLPLGVNMIIIGRGITNASDPRAAMEECVRHLNR